MPRRLDSQLFGQTPTQFTKRTHSSQTPRIKSRGIGMKKMPGEEHASCLRNLFLQLRKKMYFGHQDQRPLFSVVRTSLVTLTLVVTVTLTH